MNEQDGIEFSAIDRSQKPGEQLRKIRETKKISLEEMAKQLRFTPQRLAQIENDDYSTMGSGTFARGYLRSYARLLGMSEAEAREIIQLFDSQDLKASIVSSAPQLLHERMAHSNHKFMRGFGLLIILVIVILAGFWWHNRNSDKTAQDANVTAQDSTGVNPPDSGNAAVSHPIPLQTTPTNIPDAVAPAPQPPQAADASADTKQPSDAPPANAKKGTRTKVVVPANDE